MLQSSRTWSASPFECLSCNFILPVDAHLVPSFLAGGFLLEFAQLIVLYLAEREDSKMTLHIFGRDCLVPRELPFSYTLKVERMLRGGEPITGKENMELLKRLLTEDDYEYVTTHPEFRASYFWEIIASGWLRQDKPQKKQGEFKTEDDLRVEASKVDAAKKNQSAR